MTPPARDRPVAPPAARPSAPPYRRAPDPGGWARGGGRSVENNVERALDPHKSCAQRCSQRSGRLLDRRGTRSARSVNSCAVAAASYEERLLSAKRCSSAGSGEQLAVRGRLLDQGAAAWIRPSSTKNGLASIPWICTGTPLGHTLSNSDVGTHESEEESSLGAGARLGEHLRRGDAPGQSRRRRCRPAASRPCAARAPSRCRTRPRPRVRETGLDVVEHAAIGPGRARGRCGRRRAASRRTSWTPGVSP